MTLPEFLDKILGDRYTGAFTVHCTQGTPTAVELPKKPERIAIDRQTGMGVRFVKAFDRLDS